MASPYDSSSASAGSGERKRTLDEVFSLVYEELRHIARFLRRNEPGATINSTGLVHEAWLKLKDSPHLAATSDLHFKAIAARAMRQILVDAARRRNAQKRGAGEAIFVTLDDHPDRAAASSIEVLAIDMALTRLEALDARQAKIFEYRYFSGMSVAETASVLSASESLVERDWRAAKAWLAVEMRPAGLRARHANGGVE
jgi:RNA polymerase sigma factor (TIGR02999 family)